MSTELPRRPDPSLPRVRRGGRHAAAVAHRPWRRTVAVVATVLTGAGGVVVTGQAFAADRPDSRHPGGPPPAGSDAPAAIRPPAGVVPVARYTVATGAQVYTCTNGAFVLKAPEATLVSARRRTTIHHFAGPSWQSNADGSLVTAAKVADSPVPGAIAQLLLTVTGHRGDPNGELAKVTFIQRLNTRGGLAPTGACTAGAEQPVAYHADYVFFAPR